MEDNKYKEALERAKKWYFNKEYKPNEAALVKEILTDVFSELKSNNDEEMKESIKKVLANTDFKRLGIEYSFYDMVNWLEKQGVQINLPQFTFDDVLTLQCCMETAKKVQEDKKLYEALLILHNKVYDAYHLEKQGEQKPVIEMKTPEESLGISSEKYNDIVNQCLYVESQFKVGDWVICTDDEETVSTKKIIKFYDNKVKLVDTNGTYVVFPKSELKYYHLWSIADARRGDVLVSPLSIFIFKRIYMAGKPEAYCGLMVDTDDFIIREPGCWTNNKCWPATKEERERLFSKMLKSGYKWDVKNKELIPLQPVSKPSKVVWSDEDETGFSDTLWAINKARTIAKDENDMGNLWYAENWLKELKEKIGG